MVIDDDGVENLDEELGREDRDRHAPDIVSRGRVSRRVKDPA